MGSTRESDEARLARLMPPPPEPQDYEARGAVADRLLIVDDDPDIAKFIALNLGSSARFHGPFRVVDIAGDGAEALQLVSEHRYDLISTNILMPGISGFELVGRLRGRPDTAETPILILSAKSLSTDKVLGLTAGASDYIIKPFDPIELIARVRALLRRRGQIAHEGG